MVKNEISKMWINLNSDVYTNIIISKFLNKKIKYVKGQKVYTSQGEDIWGFWILSSFYWLEG